FQAEDGIRDFHVTGVQTCALPICAAEMDEKTRSEDTVGNASMILALMWYHAGEGKGEKDMVILPYCDRLSLMSKYLQQLVMESRSEERRVGKECRAGVSRSAERER